MRTNIAHYLAVEALGVRCNAIQMKKLMYVSYSREYCSQQVYLLLLRK